MVHGASQTSVLTASSRDGWVDGGVIGAYRSGRC